MTELRALFFADWRSFVNDLKRIRQSPMRIVFALGYALMIAGFLLGRSVKSGRQVFGPGGDIARADYLLCGLLLALFLTFAFGAGQLGVFRTRAEALLVTGSSVPAPLAIVYLQTRETIGLSIRFLMSAFYFAFIAAPRQLTPIAAVADIALFCALVGARNVIALPLRFAPPAVRMGCRVVGVSLAVLVLEPPLRDIARSLPLPAAAVHFMRHTLPAWHPGEVLFVPNPLWLGGAIAVMAIAIALVARKGREVYPELYALSLARIDAVAFRADRLSNARAKQRARPPVAVRLPAPSGPPVFVWKSIVEFRRQHDNLALLIGGAVLWVLVGACVAFNARSADIATLVTVGSVGYFFTYAVSILTTTSMTADLRRPLFWLSGSPLFERVCALVAAQNWRKTWSFALIAFGVALAGGPGVVVLEIALLMPVFAIFFSSVGLAIYALVPENVGPSATGPGLIAIFVLLIPVIPIALLGGMAGAALDIAIVGATFLAESAVLIAFATWRIDGRIDRLVA